MLKNVKTAITPGFVALIFAFGVALYVHGENERLARDCTAHSRK